MFFYGMDLTRAIQINHAALTRIIANLIAMVAFATENSAERISRSFYRAVLLVLLPAETAVRRLIIMAAHGIKIAPASPKTPKTMPTGLVITRTTKVRNSFQLFDARKRFDDARPWGAGPKPVPRVYFIDADPPFAPPFQKPKDTTAPQPVDTSVSATQISRRLATIKHALENLPLQAKRMARWCARRAKMKNPKFRSPIRPGPPPGHRKKNRDPVDEVLKDCHALAWEALRENTS